MKGVYGLFSAGMDLKNLIKMSGFQHALDSCIRSGQFQVSASGAYRGQQTYESAQAAAIHILNAGQVQNKGRARVANLAEELFYPGTQRIGLIAKDNYSLTNQHANLPLGIYLQGKRHESFIP